jgi:hypothetical protein
LLIGQGTHSPLIPEHPDLPQDDARLPACHETGPPPSARLYGVLCTSRVRSISSGSRFCPVCGKTNLIGIDAEKHHAFRLVPTVELDQPWEVVEKKQRRSPRGLDFSVIA